MTARDLTGQLPLADAGGRRVYGGVELGRWTPAEGRRLQQSLGSWLDRWRPEVNAGRAVLLVAADGSHVIAVPIAGRR